MDKEYMQVLTSVANTAEKYQMYACVSPQGLFPQREAGYSLFAHFVWTKLVPGI